MNATQIVTFQKIILNVLYDGMINSMNSLFKTQILCCEFSLIIINTLQDSLVKNKTKSQGHFFCNIQRSRLTLITFSMPGFTVVRRRKFLISLCNGHFFVQKCINILIDQKPDIRLKFFLKNHRPTPSMSLACIRFMNVDKLVNLFFFI